MSSITISELKVTGLDLFEDQESYLTEVSDAEMSAANGGFTTPVVTFITASSPECAAFAGGIVAGAAVSVKVTEAFK